MLKESIKHVSNSFPLPPMQSRKEGKPDHKLTKSQKTFESPKSQKKRGIGWELQVGTSSSFGNMCAKDPFFHHNKKFWYAKDAVLGVVLFALAVEKTSKYSVGRAYILTRCGGLQLEPFKVGKGTRYSSAIGHLPNNQKDCIERCALAMAMLQYFSKIPKSVLIASEKSVRYSELPSRESAVFDEMHAADIVANAETIRHKPAQIASQIDRFTTPRTVPFVGIDVVISTMKKNANNGLDHLQELTEIMGLPKARLSEFVYPDALRCIGDDATKEQVPILKKFSGRLKNLLIEFYQTEINYIEKLKHIVNEYLIPTRRPQPNGISLPLDKSTKRILFPSSLQRILFVNERFLKEAWIAETMEDLSLCCLKHFEYFRMPYNEFFKSRIENESILQQALKSDAFLIYNDQMRKKTSFPVGCKEILVEPIQRIPRYSLLLDSIVSRLEIGDEAIPLMRKALDIVHSIGAYGGPQTFANAYTSQMLTKTIEGFPLQILNASTELCFALDVSELNYPDEGEEKEPMSLLLFNERLVFVRRKTHSETLAKNLIARIGGLKLNDHVTDYKFPDDYEAEFVGWIDLECVDMSVLKKYSTLRLDLTGSVHTSEENAEYHGCLSTRMFTLLDSEFSQAIEMTKQFSNAIMNRKVDSTYKSLLNLGGVTLQCAFYRQDVYETAEFKSAVTLQIAQGEIDIDWANMVDRPEYLLSIDSHQEGCVLYRSRVSDLDSPTFIDRALVGKDQKKEVIYRSIIGTEAVVRAAKCIPKEPTSLAVTALFLELLMEGNEKFFFIRNGGRAFAPTKTISNLDSSKINIPPSSSSKRSIFSLLNSSKTDVSTPKVQANNNDSSTTQSKLSDKSSLKAKETTSLEGIKSFIAGLRELGFEYKDHVVANAMAEEEDKVFVIRDALIKRPTATYAIVGTDSYIGFCALHSFVTEYVHAKIGPLLNSEQIEELLSIHSLPVPDSTKRVKLDKIFTSKNTKLECANNLLAYFIELYRFRDILDSENIITFLSSFFVESSMVGKFSDVLLYILDAPVEKQVSENTTITAVVEQQLAEEAQILTLTASGRTETAVLEAERNTPIVFIAPKKKQSLGNKMRHRISGFMGKDKILYPKSSQIFEDSESATTDVCDSEQNTIGPIGYHSQEVSDGSVVSDVIEMSNHFGFLSSKKVTNSPSTTSPRTMNASIEATVDDAGVLTEIVSQPVNEFTIKQKNGIAFGTEDETDKRPPVPPKDSEKSNNEAVPGWQPNSKEITRVLSSMADPNLQELAIPELDRRANSEMDAGSRQISSSRVSSMNIENVAVVKMAWKQYSS